MRNWEMNNLKKMDIHVNHNLSSKENYQLNLRSEKYDDIYIRNNVKLGNIGIR